MENLRRDNETQIAYHRRRLAELKEVRQPWEAEWRALAEHIEPTRLRLYSDREGPRSRDKIIDSTGSHAYETLKSGMHSGLTSPARPWFRLTTFDPDLKKQDSVKVYLAAVQDKMREVFAASNLYRAFHIGYGDLGQFGQSVAILVEDEETVIRVQQLVHGRFWIARDHKGKATTLYRVFRWSVQRIIERFGYDNVPERLRSLYDSSKYGECFDVYHAIEPRYDRDPKLIDKRNKAFLSNYWIDETGGDLLEESGFDSNPIIAPAWELSEDDHYALSPGQKARLGLLALRLTEPNFYLMDEPTNHVDIPGREALESEILASEATAMPGSCRRLAARMTVSEPRASLSRSVCSIARRAVPSNPAHRVR